MPVKAYACLQVEIDFEFYEGFFFREKKTIEADKVYEFLIENPTKRIEVSYLCDSKIYEGINLEILSPKIKSINNRVDALRQYSELKRVYRINKDSVSYVIDENKWEKIYLCIDIEYEENANEINCPLSEYYIYIRYRRNKEIESYSCHTLAENSKYQFVIFPGMLCEEDITSGTAIIMAIWNVIGVLENE